MGIPQSIGRQGLRRVWNGSVVVGISGFVFSLLFLFSYYCFWKIPGPLLCLSCILVRTKHLCLS